MRYPVRFLWNATKGHRLAPWRSPYLLWRIETYCGVKMTQIGFLEFWEFMWRERGDLWHFLKWTGEMEGYIHPKPKRSEEAGLRAFSRGGRFAQNDVYLRALANGEPLSGTSPAAGQFAGAPVTL